MRAEIVRASEGFTATFNRHIKGRQEKVWAMLTENEKLQQWFPELKVNHLQKEGSVLFHFEDGSSEKLEILEFEEGEVFGFEWAEGTVCFKIIPAPEGSHLVMVETFPIISPHTAKDLTGWHTCLDVITALVEGRQIDRQQEWKKEYDEYKRLLESMSVDLE